MLAPDDVSHPLVFPFLFSCCAAAAPRSPKKNPLCECVRARKRKTRSQHTSRVCSLMPPLAGDCCRLQNFLAFAVENHRNVRPSCPFSHPLRRSLCPRKRHREHRIKECVIPVWLSAVLISSSLSPPFASLTRPPGLALLALYVRARMLM